MPVSKKIRLATEEDGASLLEIYSGFITDTAITFEVEVPSVSEFRKRISNILEKFPWLVCEIDGETVGYAYASKHRERAAYQWAVDLSIYIKPEYHRKHIATALYTALMELLKMQGFYNAYAGVTLPNVKSERFHEFFGFKPVGVYHKVGYKLGEWRDVKWFELELADHSGIPAPTKSIDEIKGSERFRNILENATRIIK